MIELLRDEIFLAFEKSSKLLFMTRLALKAGNFLLLESKKGVGLDGYFWEITYFWSRTCCVVVYNDIF